MKRQKRKDEDEKEDDDVKEDEINNAEEKEDDDVKGYETNKTDEKNDEGKNESADLLGARSYRLSVLKKAKREKKFK